MKISIKIAGSRVKVTGIPESIPNFEETKKIGFPEEGSTQKSWKTSGNLRWFMVRSTGNPWSQLKGIRGIRLFSGKTLYECRPRKWSLTESVNRPFSIIHF